MATRTVSGEYVECPNCGHDEKEITYFDTLAPMRECPACGHTW
ncbi:hypothetical protein C471_08565 [Halorubrum saccharovorum DSM 1137]|uniref:Uncharacterized protein n=1 Tax=Halorubrum saccharovorum DSM 1137 TaxID=1227484 RepID=M0DWW3_9EURY|nr:hypothetical protein [Halorubrum saccharovorum]ELZ39318.1 hypothetical protein C471_08565 [Halorubrum saccharovorum DSM 1137]